MGAMSVDWVLAAAMAVYAAAVVWTSRHVVTRAADAQCELANQRLAAAADVVIGLDVAIVTTELAVYARGMKLLRAPWHARAVLDALDRVEHSDRIRDPATLALWDQVRQSCVADLEAGR